MFPSRSLGSRFLGIGLFVGVALAAAACAAPTGDPVVGSNDSDLTEQATPLGDIGENDSKTGSYSDGGAHAYSFVAVGGDPITADVTLIGGSAQAWITDANFTVLQTGNGSGADSTVNYVVPAGGYRTLNIVFKDPHSSNGNFHVQLTTPPGACNATSEPWHHYRGTFAECSAGLHINCAAPARIFHNNCGCGCEDPA